MTEARQQERFIAARKSTWISIVVNLLLSIVQIVAGFIGRSQSLIADGLHTFSDLLSDLLVLYANKKGSKSADANHPYGHARIETAATLILGVALGILGIMLLINAGMRLQQPELIQTVHPMTLAIAFMSLIMKEGLFRYLLAVALRVRSQMLVANAWHARSDAASSLVVLIGIAGNLLGYQYLDLIATAVIGVMISHMGIKLAYGAISELIDTSMNPEEVAAIRTTVLKTSGVVSINEMRTRKMADHGLVDIHIVVEPKISVSEGHYVAEQVRKSILKNHHVLNVMVHIDPEMEMGEAASGDMPNREDLLRQLQLQFEDELPERVMLHFLNGKIEVELYIDESTPKEVVEKWQRNRHVVLDNNPCISNLVIYKTHAQK